MGALDGRQCMSIPNIRQVTGLSYNAVRGALRSLSSLIVDRGDYFDLKARRAADK